MIWFLFCYDRNFRTSLSNVKQAEIVEAFTSTSTYLDEGMMSRILLINKAKAFDFLDWHFSATSKEMNLWWKIFFEIQNNQKTDPNVFFAI